MIDKARDLYYDKDLPTMVDAIMQNITVSSHLKVSPYALLDVKLLFVSISLVVSH